MYNHKATTFIPYKVIFVSVCLFLVYKVILKAYLAANLNGVGVNAAYLPHQRVIV